MKKTSNILLIVMIVVLLIVMSIESFINRKKIIEEITYSEEMLHPRQQPAEHP